MYKLWKLLAGRRVPGGTRYFPPEGYYHKAEYEEDYAPTADEYAEAWLHDIVGLSA
jgi:hypothetical protein